MKSVRDIALEVCPAHLGKNIRSFTPVPRDGTIGYSLLGAEVAPKPDIGVVVAHQDGYYVQKTGAKTFAMHKESLLPCALTVGDKYEITHAGFNGCKEEGTVPDAENGMQFRMVTLSRRYLQSPKRHQLLQDMTEQLSELKLPDGRRGLHMLSDLKFKDFRGDADEELTINPYLEFEVAGAKFTGTVRMELILGMDTYELHFTDENGTTKLEDVVAMEVLELIEKHCDSSPARLATVKLISKAKTPKAKAGQPA
jgi:hypothetical protein